MSFPEHVCISHKSGCEVAVPVTFAHTFLAPAWLLGVGASLCSGPLLLQCKRGCGCSRSAYCSSRSGGLCLTSHRPTHLSPLHCLRCYLPLVWHRAIRWADSSEPWGGVGWGWGVDYKLKHLNCHALSWLHSLRPASKQRTMMEQKQTSER